MNAFLFFAFLTLAQGSKSTAIRSDELVIYNEHNSTARNNGAKRVNVFLLNNGKVVWSAQNVELDWSTRDDLDTKLPIPTEKYDAIRIEIVQWYGEGGGLSEVELWQGGKNIALGRFATSAKPHREGDPRGPWCVTDGVTSSKTHLKGYWLLPNGEPGSVEIDLTRPSNRRKK